MGLDKILYNYLLWDFSYSYAIPILYYSSIYQEREERVPLILLNFEFDRTTERIRDFVYVKSLPQDNTSKVQVKIVGITIINSLLLSTNLYKIRI